MKKAQIKWHYLLLAGIIVLSFLLNFLFIEKAGEGNSYYTAAVKSMLSSFKNFIYDSFDNGGFVTVDKPPLGLWIQALSAAIFGVSGWSVILPEALAGAFSVLLLYFIVKRNFGKSAGLLSALVLAITPVLVAVSRTNNVDAMLLLFILLATWFFQKAVETSRFRWLLVSAVIVGLGFNIKMMEAFLILPAFFFFYLLGADRKGKLLKLSGAFAVLLLVSFSWGIFMDMTPPEKRPYVGGSMTNSVMELAFGYNGVLRVLPASVTEKLLKKALSSDSLSSETHNATEKRTAGTVAGSGKDVSPLSMFSKIENDDPGLLRLFNKKLGGQISWFFILALFAFPAVIISLKKEERNFKNPQIASLVLWGMWLLPMFLYFSISGFFHRYYLVMLAPALAALTGIAVIRMWDLYKNKKKGGFLLPTALFLNLVLQVIFLAFFPPWGRIMIPLITILVILSVWLLAARKLPVLLRFKQIFPAVLAVAMAALMIAPATWALTPLIYGEDPVMPFSGPELAVKNQDRDSLLYFMNQSKKMMDNVDFDKLITFLEKHNNGEKFLVSVPNAPLAAPLMLKTGDAVMAAGGFMGMDRILNVKRLSHMTEQGDIRYMVVVDLPSLMKEASSLLSRYHINLGDDKMLSGLLEKFSKDELYNWITKHGVEVPRAEWFKLNKNPEQSVAFRKTLQVLGDSFHLYDLKPHT